MNFKWIVIFKICISFPVQNKCNIHDKNVHFSNESKQGDYSWFWLFLPFLERIFFHRFVSLLCSCAVDTDSWMLWIHGNSGAVSYMSWFFIEYSLPSSVSVPKFRIYYIIRSCSYKTSYICSPIFVLLSLLLIS